MRPRPPVAESPVDQKRYAGPEQHDTRRDDYGPENAPKDNLQDKGGSKQG